MKGESLPSQSLATTSFSSFKWPNDQWLFPDLREEVDFVLGLMRFSAMKQEGGGGPSIHKTANFRNAI